MRAGQLDSQATAAQATVNEQRLAGIYGDDGLDPARLPCCTLAARMATALVHELESWRGRMSLW